MAPLKGFTSAFDLPISTSDVISWVYEQGECTDYSKPLYYDAQDSSRFWNKSQARSTVRKLVAGFRKAGLKPGDCVLVHSFNDINYPLMVQGIVAAGGIFTGSNPSYTVSELDHQMKTATVKFIISEPEISSAVLEAASRRGISYSNIWIFDNTVNQEIPLGHRSWRELLSHGEQDWVRFDSYEVASTKTACRLFSSGTTGPPKAVELTHYNLIAQHVGVMQANRRPYDRIYASSIPIFHASATPFIHFQNIFEGNIVHLFRRFDLKKFLKKIQEKRVTELILVPAMVIMILMDPETKFYDFSSIRSVLVGAAPLDKSIQDRFRNEVLAPGTRLTQGWGMTEICCTGTMFFWPEDDTTASIGRPINGLEIKLTDDSGKEIQAYDTPGEMLVRGPSVSPGYYLNPIANAETFCDGFLRTGDIGLCSAKDRKWYIVDRKKELIKVRGFQVAPVEIEGVLMTHPNIVDAAVIGVSAHQFQGLTIGKSKFATEAAIAGELVRAYVVKRPGKEDMLDEKEVLQYAAGRLAGYKRITGGVIFVNEIPKNASGKILKRQLRDMVMEEMKYEQSITRANL